MLPLKWYVPFYTVHTCMHVKYFVGEELYFSERRIKNECRVLQQYLVK
jgi:hypothetical protein